MQLGRPLLAQDSTPEKQLHARSQNQQTRVRIYVAHLNVTFVLSSSSVFLLASQFKSFLTNSAWERGKSQALETAE